MPGYITRVWVKLSTVAHIVDPASGKEALDQKRESNQNQMSNMRTACADCLYSRIISGVINP